MEGNGVNGQGQQGYYYDQERMDDQLSSLLDHHHHQQQRRSSASEQRPGQDDGRADGDAGQVAGDEAIEREMDLIRAQAPEPGPRVGGGDPDLIRLESPGVGTAQVAGAKPESESESDSRTGCSCCVAPEHLASPTPTRPRHHSPLTQPQPQPQPQPPPSRSGSDHQSHHRSLTLSPPFSLAHPHGLSPSLSLSPATATAAGLMLDSAHHQSSFTPKLPYLESESGSGSGSESDSNHNPNPNPNSKNSNPFSASPEPGHSQAQVSPSQSQPVPGPVPSSLAPELEFTLRLTPDQSRGDAGSGSGSGSGQPSESHPLSLSATTPAVSSLASRPGWLSYDTQLTLSPNELELKHSPVIHPSLSCSQPVPQITLPASILQAQAQAQAQQLCLPNATHPTLLCPSSLSTNTSELEHGFSTDDDPDRPPLWSGLTLNSMAAAPLPVIHSDQPPTTSIAQTPEPLEIHPNIHPSPSHWLSDDSLGLRQSRVKKSSKLRDTERWARQTSSQRSSPDRPPSPNLIHPSSLEPIHSSAPLSNPATTATTSTTTDLDRPRISLQPVPHLRSLNTLEPDSLIHSEHATVNDWQSERTIPSAHPAHAPPQTAVSLSPIEIQVVAQTPTSAELLAPPITAPSGPILAIADDPFAHFPLTPSLSDPSRPRTAPEPITPPPDPLLRARISLQEALSTTPQARSNPASPRQGAQPLLGPFEGFSDHSSEPAGEPDDGSGSGLSPINEDRTAELAAEHSSPIRRAPSRTPPRPVSYGPPRRAPSPRNAPLVAAQPSSSDHTLASMCSSGCEDCAAQRTGSSQFPEEGVTQPVSLDEERTSQTVSSVRSSDEVVLPSAAAAVEATLSARRQAVPLSVRTGVLPLQLQRTAPPLSLPASARRPMPGDVLSRLEMEEWRHQTGIDDRYALPLPARPGEGPERSLVGLGGEERRGMKDRWGNSWGLEAHVLSPLSERTERSLTTVGSCLSLSTRPSVHSLRSLDSTAHSLAQRLDQAAEVAGTRKLKLGPTLVPSAVVRTAAVLRTASCPTGQGQAEGGLGEEKVRRKEERRLRREKREKRMVDEQRRSESLAEKQERRRLEKQKKEMFLDRKQELIRRLQEDPGDPTIVRDLGILYLSCNAGLAGLKLAIRHLETSLQMSDSDPVSWSSLGKAWAAVHALGYGAESAAEVAHQTHNAGIGLRKAIMNSRTAQEALTFKVEWARYLERLGRWRDSLGVMREVIKNEGRQAPRCWAALGFIGQRIVFGWQPLADISTDELQEGFLPGRQPAPGTPVAGLADLDRAKLLIQVRQAFEHALGLLDPNLEQNKRYGAHYLYQLEAVHAVEQEMRAQGLGLTESLASECACSEACQCTPTAPVSVSVNVSGGAQTRGALSQATGPTRALDQDRAEEREQQHGDRLDRASDEAVGMRAPVVEAKKEQTQAGGKLGSPARLGSSAGRRVIAGPDEDGQCGRQADGHHKMLSGLGLVPAADENGRASQEVSSNGGRAEVGTPMSEAERTREVDGPGVRCDPEPTSYGRLLVSPPSGRGAPGQSGSGAGVPDSRRWPPTGAGLLGGNLGTVIDPDGCSDAGEVVAVQYDDVDTTNDYSDERAMEDPFRAPSALGQPAQQFLSPAPASQVGEEDAGGSGREYSTPLSSAGIGGGGVGESGLGSASGLGSGGGAVEEQRESVVCCGAKEAEPVRGGGKEREQGAGASPKQSALADSPVGCPRQPSKSPGGCPRPASNSSVGCTRPASKSPVGCPRPPSNSPVGCTRPASNSPGGCSGPASNSSVGCPRPASNSPGGCSGPASKSPSKSPVADQCRDQTQCMLLDSAAGGREQSSSRLGSPCCRPQADSQASSAAGLDRAQSGWTGTGTGTGTGSQVFGRSPEQDRPQSQLAGSRSDRAGQEMGRLESRSPEEVGHRAPLTTGSPGGSRSQVDVQPSSPAGMDRAHSGSGSQVRVGGTAQLDRRLSQPVPGLGCEAGQGMESQSRCPELGHGARSQSVSDSPGASQRRPDSQASQQGGWRYGAEQESRGRSQAGHSRADGDGRSPTRLRECEAGVAKRSNWRLEAKTGRVSGWMDKDERERCLRAERGRERGVGSYSERGWDGERESEASLEEAGDGLRGRSGSGSGSGCVDNHHHQEEEEQQRLWWADRKKCCARANEKLKEIDRCQLIAILEMEREYYRRRKELREKLEAVEEEYEERRVEMLEALGAQGVFCGTEEDVGGVGRDAGRFADAEEGLVGGRMVVVVDDESRGVGGRGPRSEAVELGGGGQRRTGGAGRRMGSGAGAAAGRGVVGDGRMAEQAAGIVASGGSGSGAGSALTCPAGSALTRPAGSALTRPAGSALTCPAGSALTCPAGSALTCPAGSALSCPAGSAVTCPVAATAAAGGGGGRVGTGQANIALQGIAAILKLAASSSGSTSTGSRGGGGSRV